ncbi:unnamed protein product [Lactuca saligna]|uniref:Retrotransposon gag domain-containing protein n=1 Tax=Lactuca saligna TaxID=75948 RepID=A0AA35VK41_LACSI|nr:unnamed protein product [Lactuca saligna]
MGLGPVDRRRRRSRQIRGRLLHFITGSKVNKLQMDGEMKNDSGKVTQDMDQGNCESSVDSFSLESLVKDINKIVRCIGSMVNKFEDLNKRVQLMEKKLKKYQQYKDYKFKIPTEEKPSSKVHIPPAFPEKFDHAVFCKWVKDVELYFESGCVSEHEKVKHVVCTLPRDGEAFKWWQGIQELSNTVDKIHVIRWNEMKRLVINKFLCPKIGLIANKTS